MMAYCCPDPDDRGTRKGTLYTLNLRAAEIAPEAIDPLPGHGLCACRRFLIHILYTMERVRRDSSRKSTERRRTRPVQNGIRRVGLVEADPIDSSVFLFLVYPGSFENSFDVTNGMSGHLKFFHQPANNVFFEGPPQDDVHNADAGMFGRQTLNPTNPLFDNHRIPRKVKIHQNIRRL